MPYIITTTSAYAHPSKSGTIVPHSTRTTVATLEEAREAVHTQLSQTDADLNDMASFFPVECVVPAAGGTVGPLPDGTVIEVERVTLADI